MKASRTRPMEDLEVRARAAHARQFLEAARNTRDLNPDHTNVIASDAVLAGIAAADAICGRVLQKRSAGENHSDAVALLKTATVDGPRFARDLQRLVEIKTNTQYSPMTTTKEMADRAIQWASRLVAAMEELLLKPR